MVSSLPVCTIISLVAVISVKQVEGAFLDRSRAGTHFVEVGQTGTQVITAKREEPDDAVPQQRNPAASLSKGHSSMPSKVVQEKYPFIYGCHNHLSSVFGRKEYADHWYMDWKLWVGGTIWLAVWGRWLKHGYEETFWVQALFAFGINIMILHHLQYALTIKLGMAVVCALLSLQAICQSYLWSRSELSFREGSPRGGIGSRNGGDKEDQEEFEVETMYLDLALPLEQICVLFAAQVCVSWFYLTYILANYQVENVNYSFWVVAYLTMQMTMIFCRGADSALGKAFPSHDVYELWHMSEHIRLALKGGSGKSFKVSRFNIALRGITGFFCNAVLREILAYTMPLMLMSFAEPMDFVVYCVGCNFICTIDDTKDRTYLVKQVEDEQEQEVN